MLKILYFFILTFLVGVENENSNNISKRLGPNETKLILEAIEGNNMKEFIRLTLVYYDKTYSNGLLKRASDNIFELEVDYVNPFENARKILSFYHHIQQNK